MSEKCLISNSDVKGREGVKVGLKGIRGLVKASVLLHDGKSELFRQLEEGFAHVNCRKSYTRPQTIRSKVANLAVPSTSCVGPLLRSLQPLFNYSSNCLFCGEQIPDDFQESEKKKPIHLRRWVSRVRALSTDNTIAVRALERGDEWGHIVHGRNAAVSDLRAADAIYHRDCNKKFFLKIEPSMKKRGRPELEDITKAMEEIYCYIEGSDDCQFSFNELLQQISGPQPHIKTIKEKMKAKYGDRIVLTSITNNENIVTFRGSGEQRILNDAWYSARFSNEEEERGRIVRTAARIILEDVECMTYINTTYPAADEFCNEAEKMVPVTLRSFMETLSSKKRSKEKVEKKMTAISHSLIAAIRPRSFVSPILTGVAFFIHRRFGSKTLIHLLSNLGFSETYHNANQLEISILNHPLDATPTNIFTQYVYDNADFNISTVDGYNTFHSMGGIKCITPASAIPTLGPIEKVNKTTKATDGLTQLGVLELQSYEPAEKSALTLITIENLNETHPIPSDIFTPTLQDILWMSGKWLHSIQPCPGLIGLPEWKAFMELTTNVINQDMSTVTFLPFINSPPSDYNTVHTALQYAVNDSDKNGAKVCFVTFDQPLYIKAREIQSRNMVVRLGGFHTLMSYMGCIGQTMAGSGLKEVLSEVYAPNSVDKILTGHAYSRAVRGHLLVQTVLAQIILEGASITMEEKNIVINVLEDLQQVTPQKLDEDATVKSVLNKFIHDLNHAKEKNGPTAALWVQYFNMVTLLKKFIDCERRGDWNGHLTCTQQMIPFFHASGHFNYAKCAHLYVQDMLAVQSKYPDAFKDFEEKGYFTVNRTGKPWAGVWTDMTVEQTLMRTMKTSGGLIGRGFTDSVLAKWVGASPTGAAICSSLENFAAVSVNPDTMHLDFRRSQQQRNAKDRAKIYLWFRNHPPFLERDCLMSLATGVIGNATINCHLALEVGTNTMKTFVGCKFSDIKQTKKNMVLSLGSMNNLIKVNGVSVTIDPLTIFHRALISKKNDEDVAELLKFELSPYPLALFNEGGLRKGKKSALCEAFPLDSSTTHDLKSSYNIVDGGFLLHRVKWNVGSTFGKICDLYVKYIICHYGEQCTVVFDGYGDANNTKRAEQKRRGLSKTSVNIHFDETTSCTIQQENFLSNEFNKTRLINFLAKKIEAQGLIAVLATGDADTKIVSCGLQAANQHQTVTVIGEDIDLLVLLIALTPPEKEMLFFKPSRGKVESRWYNVANLQKLPYAKTILLLHSFSGCDTTSAIYNKSKGGVVKVFLKAEEEVTDIYKVFSDPLATQDMVADAGELLFLALYQAPKEANLSRVRHQAFVKASTKPRPDFAALPPTRGAARQHSLRVYLQLQYWLHGNQQQEPTAWGWLNGLDGFLTPVTSTDPVAPESVLNNIFCGCKTGCGSRCGCRKAGIPCSLVCSTCRASCTNGPPIIGINGDDDDDNFDDELEQ